MKPPLPVDEAARLEALQQYDILDTSPEQAFDDLVQLAAQICGTPMSAITLVDEKRQWFKARVGVEVAETSRDISFCAHAILEPDILVVRDASEDERFADNPLVTTDPHIRFYAGVPLVTPEGHAIGALCVIDTMPRQLDPTQQDALHKLGRQATALLEGRPDTSGKEQSRQVRLQVAQQQRALVSEMARRSAEKLKISEERYRRLFESAQEGILILDAATGEIEDANPYLCHLLGYTTDEILGKQLWEIRTLRDIAANQEALRALQDKGYMLYADLPFESKDGQSTSVECVSNVYTSGGKQVIQCNIRDTTERKRSEEAKSFLASIVESSEDSILTINFAGIITSWNKAAETFYGYSAEEVVGKPLTMLTLPEDLIQVLTNIDKIKHNETVEIFNTTRLNKNGRRMHLEVTLSPVRDAMGEIIGVSTIARDITARIQAERAMQKANDELEMNVMERTAELGAVNESLRMENFQHRTTMDSLRQAAKALEQAGLESERANRAKSEFLSRMSHELRTPLNAILGFGQILDTQNLAPLQKESVGYILKGGRHLLELINEVLDIARVEAGHLELSLEPIALTDIVPEACALVRPLAAERSIRLEEHAAELAHNYILADRQRLKQVLINLLSNAIKYNREAGQVEVFCEPKPDGRIAIAVRDTGPGIAPEDLPKLFTAFERLNAENFPIEGTGLGLVLSQQLVRGMGGTLNVQSTLGQGTTFTLEMPQAPAPEEQRAHSPHKAHAAEAGQRSERTYSVLCIEDNPSNFRLIEAIFGTRPQWKLLTAMQGSIGLDLARRHEPDLILLDLNLPDISGKEVLTRLQQSAITQDIPVVVVSADATPHQIERLLTAGARAFLSKPLDVERFLYTLDKLLPATPISATVPDSGLGVES